MQKLSLFSNAEKFENWGNAINAIKSAINKNICYFAEGPCYYVDKFIIVAPRGTYRLAIRRNGRGYTSGNWAHIQGISTYSITSFANTGYNGEACRWKDLGHDMEPGANTARMLTEYHKVEGSSNRHDYRMLDDVPQGVYIGNVSISVYPESYSTESYIEHLAYLVFVL